MKERDEDEGCFADIEDVCNGKGKRLQIGKSEKSFSKVFLLN